MDRQWIWGFLLMALFATGLKAEEQEISAEAETLFATVCATCHGSEGHGNPELKAPSIAGLPTWFIEHQFEKFRHGVRGEASDEKAAQMAAIAKSIPEAQIPEIAKKVASLKIQPTQATLTGGDPVNGEKIYMETCAECHRYNGQGEKVFHSAPLTHLPDWYIHDMLMKFKTGQRGGHPEDVEGAKMQQVTRWLSEGTFADLTAWIATLAEKYPPDEPRRRGPRSAPSIQIESFEELEEE